MLLSLFKKEFIIMSENKSQKRKVNIKIGSGNGKISVTSDEAVIKTGMGEFNIDVNAKKIKIEKEKTE